MKACSILVVSSCPTKATLNRNLAVSQKETFRRLSSSCRLHSRASNSSTREALTPIAPKASQAILRQPTQKRSTQVARKSRQKVSGNNGSKEAELRYSSASRSIRRRNGRIRHRASNCPPTKLSSLQPKTLQEAFKKKKIKPRTIYEYYLADD